MNYINKEICAKCGGACCKTSGCKLSPRDGQKEGLENRIRRLFQEGALTLYIFPLDFFINWVEFSILMDHAHNLLEGCEIIDKIQPRLSKFEEHHEVYLLKMRGENGETVEWIRNLDMYKKRFQRTGKCVKLTPLGCEYTDDERPFGGLAYIPAMREDGIFDCKMTYGNLEHAEEWLPYHNLLKKVFFDS